MSLSMYQASIPVFTRVLNSLSGILNKAEAHAAERKIEPSVLLQARLYPDMFPLVRQVQIAADVAKSGAGNLAGIEIPKFNDNEASFAELQDRVARTLKYLGGIRAEQIDGTEDKDIVITYGDQKYPFKGQGYLLGNLLPNIYFHTATTYGILRHCGVAVGKGDFLGAA